MKKRLLRLPNWKVLIGLLPVVAIVAVEVGRALWAWQAIDRAAHAGVRYAVTGSFNDTYCDVAQTSAQERCDDEATENAARLQTIYDIVRSTLAGVPAEGLRIAVCSRRAGYSYDDVNGVCRPHDDSGAPGESVIVHVAYDYPIGSFLGAGVGALPLQSTREAVVEQFRAVRIAGVPPVIAVPGQENQPVDNPVANAPLPADGHVQYAGQLRLVTLNGDAQLMVADVDASLAQINNLTAEVGGYVSKSEAWSDGEFRYAHTEVRVPANQFRAVLERLKASALKVLRETVTGQDVTEEYVDLQARLDSLRATTKRVQAFLDDAKNVNEALQVSKQLSDLEVQIEQITGRMQYLDDRVAMSTIAVSLEPDRPVPVPTPQNWQPGVTVERAVGFLGTTARVGADTLIWLVIVGVPFVVIGWVAVRVVRRTRQRRAPHM